MYIKNEDMKTDYLIEKATEYRREITELVYRARKGHIGGCFSCIDILTMLYAGHLLNYDSKNPRWNKRDIFLLSKGHCALALYVVLSDMGFFDKEMLYTFGQNGSYLGAHSDIKVPGIEISSGSLGNGIGIAVGLSLSDRKDGVERRIAVLTGDGECYEGSIWEGVMYAGHQSFSNLIWIVDRNRQCVLDYTEDINKLDPLKMRVASFGWDVEEIDGNDFGEYERVRDIINTKREKPLCIIANTVKGKGVSFMEGKLEWHHKVLSDKLYNQAIKELGGTL